MAVQLVVRSGGGGASTTVDLPVGTTAKEVVNLVAPLPAKVLRSPGSRALPAHARICELDTLDVTPFPGLSGGGGDGGVTGTDRRATLALTRTSRSGAGQLDPKCERAARWTRCSLTHEPLTKGNIAIDLTGNLFDYEALLRFLSDHLRNGSHLPQCIAHISSIKRDVVRTQLGKQPNLVSSSSSSECDNSNELLCPITGLPFNGTFRFLALKPSGVVVAERALSDFVDVVSELLPPNDSLQKQQRIVVNPEGDELEKQRASALASKCKQQKRKQQQEISESNGKRKRDDTYEAAEADGRQLIDAKELSSRIKASEEDEDSRPQHEHDMSKARTYMPSHGTEAIWNSLFTSSASAKARKPKETFTARALSGRNT
jgi:hypothetical protein